MKSYFTEQVNFFGNTNPLELIKEYGSPLYVYNESILRARCREMVNLVSYPNFKVNYSIKANSNLELLKIARQEGLVVDAISPGDVHVLFAAGFKPEDIFYISNNVSEEEMKFVIERDIIISIDSLSQLKQFGRLNPGGKVAIRFNPGVGAGHHEKVVTGGKKTKFGVNMDKVAEVKKILEEFNLTLIGINQHIGSLFMEIDPYLEGVKSVLSVAEQFDTLEFIDFGGGFGIPYRKQEGETRLNLQESGEKFNDLLTKWTTKYGKEIEFKIEPGRYIAGECGVLLGNVYTIKQNYDRTFVGTDLGFNVLARPVMYGSHHDIEVYKNGVLAKDNEEVVTVVGNICESGDIMAEQLSLPRADEGDILGVMNAGAYGYCMASTYNNRLRPAEVLLKEDGSSVLIRRRDTLEDLMRNFV
ncbi:MAG: diaminopimelate decarboxylase [Firmicutes bacterium]|nr:diaminopimelate decarboxylase [Bacillota bacterium]